MAASYHFCPSGLIRTMPQGLRNYSSLLGEDATIFQALEAIGMWEVVQLKGDLDAEMVPNSFSLWQQQRFFLSRAMLPKSLILVLDEASSR